MGLITIGRLGNAVEKAGRRRVYVYSLIVMRQDTIFIYYCGFIHWLSAQLNGRLSHRGCIMRVHLPRQL